MYKVNNIYNVDCYKAIKEIPDKSIDCIYTDIPYLYARGGGGRSALAQRTLSKKSAIASFSNGIDYSIFDEFFRVLKKVNIFVWCSRIQLLEIANIFADKGLNVDLLVWCKTNPQPTGNNVWLPDLEYCLYARERGVRLNDGYELKSRWYNSPINQGDKEKFAHPTIKPLKLVERHLLHTTQVGDVVADFFMGSGTTCVVAKNINRQYIGFEIDKKWFDVARNRLNKVDANGQIGMFLM